MKELLYIEIPTRDTAAVRSWLQAEFEPGMGQRAIAPSGIRLQIFKSTTSKSNISAPSEKMLGEISAFIWSVQRTTYLKVFRWADKPLPGEQQILQRLTDQIRSKFPHNYPEPPAIDLSQQSIFAALAPHYPLTVKYFQKMPNGEYDLTRVYWWEQRWREGVRNPQKPRQVVFSNPKGDGQGDKGSQPCAPVPSVERTGVTRGQGRKTFGLKPLTSSLSPLTACLYLYSQTRSSESSCSVSTGLVM